MSLLDSMKTPCVKLLRADTGDGLGGYASAWAEGEEFDAVIRKDSTSRHAQAQQMREAEAFTVIVDGSVSLSCHDVFRRRADGALFRMTGCTRDSQAPRRSTVPVAKAPCERWEP